jgi:hypothetical protein
MQSARVWRSTVVVGLVLILALGPASSRLSAYPGFLANHDVSVSGNDVTIHLYIDGGTTDLPTDCGLPFYPTEAWPNSIGIPSFYSTDDVSQYDITADFAITVRGIGHPDV